MSRIDDLILEHCPDGVEFLNLKDVARIRNGKDYKGFGDGDVPVYGTGGVMTHIDRYVSDQPSVLIPRKGSLNKLYYVDVPFWTVDTIFYTEIYEHMVPKFLYYFLQTQRLEELNQAGGIPSLTQSVLNELRIPVPPREVQREIAHMLGRMESLQAELQAELQARTRQYSFYRDSLLTFTDGEGVKWAALRDLAEIGTGSRNTNEGLEDGDFPFYVRSQQVRRIDSYEFDETAIITSGDGVGVGKIFHYVEGRYSLHQRAYRIHVTSRALLPKFLFYYMRDDFLGYMQMAAVRSSVTSVRKPMLQRYPVPLPPLDEQERIVAVLDKFDALVNDPLRGLAAEIRARRKQYEHYRHRLLTFAEKTA